MIENEIKNKILSEAICNKNFQKVLIQIREIVVLPTRSSSDEIRLKILFIQTKSFVDISLGEIVSFVKNATEGDLEVILGNYSGEIPVLR